MCRHMWGLRCRVMKKTKYERRWTMKRRLGFYGAGIGIECEGSGKLEQGSEVDHT